MLARGLGSCWCLLHYACLVAQISRGGDLLARALRPLGVSHSASCGILTLIFHILVFGAFGQRRAGWFAESVNNLMTVSFLVAMVSVMSLGLGEVSCISHTATCWSAHASWRDGAHKCIHTHVCTHPHVHVRIHPCTHTHTPTHTPAHAYTCTYQAKVERLARADWRPSTFIDMAPLMLQIMMYIQTVPTVCVCVCALGVCVCALGVRMCVCVP